MLTVAEFAHNEFDRTLGKTVNYVGEFFWFSKIGTLEKTVAYFDEYQEYVEWVQYKEPIIRENSKSYTLYLNGEHEITSNTFISDEIEWANKVKESNKADEEAMNDINKREAEVMRY